MPERGRCQGWSPMPDIEVLAFLAEMAEAPLFTRGEWVQVGIAASDNDRLIGDVGLDLSSDGTTGEIGFTLEPCAQGRGIATAAVRAALQLLFGRTQVQQVLGITDRRNVASIRLLERVEFRYESSRRAVFRGEPCDEEVYVIVRPQ